MSALDVDVLTAALAEARAHAKHYAESTGYWRAVACQTAEEAGRLQYRLEQQGAQAAGQQRPDALHIVANLQQQIRLLAGPDVAAEEIQTGLRELETSLARLRGMVSNE